MLTPGTPVVPRVRARSPIPPSPMSCMSERSEARGLLRKELMRRRPDKALVRSLCVDRLGGQVPDELRPQIWQVLLCVEAGRDRFLLDESIQQTALDLDNQRVIRLDVLRTRPDVERFRDADLQAMQCKLLTFYCKRRNLRYKQGLNEVLAPIARASPGRVLSPVLLLQLCIGPGGAPVSFALGWAPPLV